MEQMTGLDRETDQVMSICCFVTDPNLNLIDPVGYEAIVHHDKSILDKMDAWCTRTHRKSGLTEKCISSSTSPETAAYELLRYIKRYVPREETGLLAGNSVHCDKEFLSKGPYIQVIRYLHYRILDVSSIKEAARMWSPSLLEHAPRKKGLHQAREDILESIEEAKYYRDAIFRRNADSEKGQPEPSERA